MLVDSSQEPVSMSKERIGELASGVEPVVLPVERNFDHLDLRVEVVSTTSCAGIVGEGLHESAIFLGR